MSLYKSLKNSFDKLKMKHVREEGKTIAVLHLGNERFVGISVCSDKDQFSRKVGREVASKRALYAYTRKHPKNKDSKKQTNLVDDKYLNTEMYFYFEADKADENPAVNTIPKHLWCDTHKK